MVDPIALRKKLSKMQIGPKYPGSMANAFRAVQERDTVLISTEDPYVHEFQPTVPGGILDAEELGYCLHSFAAQWEVPA